MIVSSILFKLRSPFLRTAINFSNYTHSKGMTYLETRPFRSCLSGPYANFRPNVVQCFHTTQKLNIHPVLILIGKTAVKVGAVLTGRGFRKWWKDLPKDKRQYFKESFKRNQFKIYAFTAFTLAAFFAYYESHIQETPLTKRRRFIAFTPSQFEELADLTYKMQLELFKNSILSPDHPDCKKVATVANRILAGNKDLKEVHNKNWSITVVDNSLQNAFVLPNGEIFVLTGMIKLCTTEDQLGVILSHEMAHCILQHGAEQISFAHLFDFVVIVVLAAIWALLPSDTLAILGQLLFNKVSDLLLHLPFSRKLETEADEVGLTLAAKSCFDIRESSAFWSKMAIMAKMKGGPEEELASVDWLSTHPSHEARSAMLDSSMAKALKVRESCGCPKLPDLDPRVTVLFLKQEVQEKKRIQSTPLTVPAT